MGSCAAPSAKGDDKFITTDYLQQCHRGRSRKAQDTDQAGARFQIDPHGLCHDQGIRSHASPAQRTGSPLVPAARHQGRGAPCGESFWHWALGADGGHGHAQPPFRSSRLIGAERQPTSDCRQSLQQSLRRHAHLALVHTSIEHSRDWCRSLLILNCQELAAQQPLRPINWCSRLLKMTTC